MPMSFPDMKSLVSAAEVHKFRPPTSDESEADYRSALADHVAFIDFVESQEIRTGKGWNQWNDDEAKDMLLRSTLKAFERPERPKRVIRSVFAPPKE